MCLSTEALALFLNILSADLISTQPGRVTVHAAQEDVHWVAYGDQWCIETPEHDGATGFSK